MGHKMGKGKTIRKPLFLALFFLLFFPLILAARGDSSFGETKKSAVKKRSNGKKAVLVVINAIGIEDLTQADTPRLFELANKTGAVGLMNTRTAGGINRVNNYLTIGAGVKAAGGIRGGLAFNTDEKYRLEKAGNIYEVRTGIEAPAGGVINIAIGDIFRRSKRQKRDIYPGALGKALKKAGHEAGVLGNADVLKGHDGEPTFRREAGLIAMDQLGRVPVGDVSRRTARPDSRSVGGVNTDYERLLSQATEMLTKVDFLVVETGDTARLDEFAMLLLDWEIPRKKRTALKEVDWFIDRLIERVDLDNTLLLIASPTPSRRMRADGNNLSPLILIGPGIKPGILTSATTRRHGIVDNTDIAPTVVKFLGGEIPFYMSGRSLAGETEPNATEYLGQELQQILIKSEMRVPVLTTYVTVVAFILILSLLVLLWGEKGIAYLRLFRAILLLAISAPLAMLLTACFNYSSLMAPVVMTLFFSILLVGFSLLLRGNYLYPVLAISLLTCGALILDTITGAYLMQRSLLGYCPIIGARFYGIGNEYMGVLVGSSVIGLTLFFDVFNLRTRRSTIVLGLLFVIVTFTIGYQAFGANIGGSIGAVVAFGVTLIAIIGGKISSKHLAAIVAAILLLLTGLAALDLLRVGGNSHLGRAVILIQKGGLGEAVRIIQRKLSNNIKGTRYTAWTRILIASLVVLPTLFLRPVGDFSRIRKEYPFLTAGSIGSASGAFVAFLVNDTGAAVAATIIVFSAVVTLYIIIEEQLKRRYANID